MASEHTRPLRPLSEADIAPSPALSQTSTLFESTPRPPRQRATFARLASVDDGRYTAVKNDEDDITDVSPYDERHESHPSNVHGLGIHISKDDRNNSTPNATECKNGISFDTTDTGMWSPKNRMKTSIYSSQSSLQQSTAYEADIQRLQKRRSFAESLRTVYNGIFLILAFEGPRYKWIRKGGSMTPYVADLLTAFFAKTIELSFATVFVAFLGQVLSRRAFMKNQGRGITLAEMDMRTWVMQPGTMFTHYEALKSSIFSILGLLSLVAAVMAMLYTTASESLVQPYLHYGSWEHGTMRGLVKTIWANPTYLGTNCGTPITVAEDEIAGNTCLQIQYAAHSYYNYQRYISDWSVTARNGNGSSEPIHRPKGFAMIFENTTVKAPWVDLEYSDVSANSDKYRRIINNVTLALPHAGVPGASWDAINHILQPEDLDGQGVYQLQASVPSPAVNVLCAQMTKEDLSPIVYTEWNNNTLNATRWPTGDQLAFYQPGTEVNGTYLNKTVVDDVFGWGEKYQTSPPVFPKLPLAYNTLMNHTGAYGRGAIYLLGRDATNNYALCSIKVFQTPLCSTEYNASMVGASLEAKCSSDATVDLANKMRYIDSNDKAITGKDTINKDWVYIGTEWANSLSLNAGINDGEASNARLLTELILTTPNLPRDRPSIAEALAVLASSTLLMSWQDAPFTQFWNYSTTTLLPGEYQIFNTSLRAQEYASGGSGSQATHAFFIVLFAIFFLNVICLCYFLSQNGLVTDFSEPLNLFSLAVNSPPSEFMAGSCGGGPRGKQFKSQWFVNAAGEHLFMENKDDGKEIGDVGGEEKHRDGRFRGENRGVGMTPMRVAYEKMSRRKSWL
ncbi:hypothetical protein E4T38_01564 [Aureobasidium subglaciale]|nr:hypothetical protein E4T38_01564 [Aureobasidium subglaciale]KAI5233070.1 hypothetical protein E4T41_01562 [Aureobasidium subglaciale]